MTTGVLETQNTRLYFTDAAGSPQNIRKVACPTSIEGLGGAGGQIAITCLDSPEAEFRRGMKQPSTISVPINFIPNSASHQALMDLDESGDVVDWMVVFSDQDDAPVTLDGDNHLVSPGPTTVRFQGYVDDIAINVATNEIVRATLTIQRSGAKEWDMPAATQD